ncbi:hypothetical protein INR49_002023 [Caranx melampygus]|nr:hypothetical protein INR49_002023 [Caranx melampygus]
MAEVQEKSHGLKFAEQQLLRHGWEHGKGLGRAENGISEAIKVKVKCDKGGVGHKEGEQFTFHWWDHVFNKASSSLQVESDQGDIKLKKAVEEDEDDGTISNKKPRKASMAKAKLYGCFVKSATLLSGQEQPEPKASNSDDSSSSDEEDDQRLDLSSTTKLSDADLMKACGGRTAHKGARHGLTMSAKLARLEQQEAEFMAKYGKKSQPASGSLGCVTTAPSTSTSAERQEEAAEETRSKKKKKKKSSGRSNELNGNEVSESAETDVEPKKKRKKNKASGEAEEISNGVSTEEDVICADSSKADHSDKTKRKHKKKNKSEPSEVEEASSPAAESLEEAAELHTDTKLKKKKKKKSSKQHGEEEENNDTESNQSEQVQDAAPKTKKREAQISDEEEKVTEEKSTVKQKRKKCKKDKLLIDDKVDEEALPPKKKKKKSKE